MIYLEQLSSKTQKAVNGYYNSNRSWVFATEAVKTQKTRCAQILRSQSGTVAGLTEKLGIERSVVEVLLRGLEAMNKVEIHTDMGYGYRVKES